MKTELKKVLVLLFVLILIFSLAGCTRRTREKKAENKAENMLEGILEAQGLDADVDIDGDDFTIETDDGEITMNTGTDWPSDAPKVIPKPKQGLVTSVAKIAGSTVVNLAATDKQAKAYIDLLKENGFDEQFATEQDGDIFFGASKSGYQLTVTYHDGEMGILWQKVE